MFVSIAHLSQIKTLIVLYGHLSVCLTGTFGVKNECLAITYKRHDVEWPSDQTFGSADKQYRGVVESPLSSVFLQSLTISFLVPSLLFPFIEQSPWTAV